ncbi:MAG: hypothetical protein U0670_01170 [Anaerolineae bacterium]
MTDIVFADYTLAASGSLYDASFVRTAEFKTPDGLLITVAAVAESLDFTEQAMTAAAAVAVQTAIDTLQRTSHHNPIDILREAFESAHFQLSHQASITGKRTYCSLSIALVVDHARLYVGSVGLNRIYLRRADGSVHLITLDHNVANTRIQNGESPEAAFAAADARRPVRALGARDATLDTNIYLANREAQSAARLGERGLHLNTGDVVFVCTPAMYGLPPNESKGLSEQEIADALAHPHGMETVRSIVERTRERRPDVSISAALIQGVPGGIGSRSLFILAAGALVIVAIVAALLLQNRGVPSSGFGLPSLTPTGQAAATAEASLTLISAPNQGGSTPFHTPTLTPTEASRLSSSTSAPAAITHTITAQPTTALPTASITVTLPSTGITESASAATQAASSTPTQTATLTPTATWTATRTSTSTSTPTLTSTATLTATPTVTFTAMPTVNATVVANVSLRGADIISQSRRSWEPVESGARIDTYDGTIRQLELSLVNETDPAAQLFLLQGTALQVMAVEENVVHISMADSGDAFFTSLSRTNRLHVQFDVNPSLEFIMTGSCMSLHFLQADLVMASCYDGLCSVSFPGSTNPEPTLSAGQQVILQPSTGLASSIIPISINEARHYASALPVAERDLQTTAACLAAYLPDEPVLMTAVARASLEAATPTPVPPTETRVPSTRRPTRTPIPTQTETPVQTDVPTTEPLFATNTPDLNKPTATPAG